MADVASTSLYNRFLLREKVAFDKKALEVDMKNVAHFAIVIG